MIGSRSRLAVGALALIGLELAAVVVLAAAGWVRHSRTADRRAAGRELVSALGLTELALWSAASYCRHPATGDPFAAVADHPSAMEHFPAGSLVPPPPPAVLGWSHGGRQAGP